LAQQQAGGGHIDQHHQCRALESGLQQPGQSRENRHVHAQARNQLPRVWIQPVPDQQQGGTEQIGAAQNLQGFQIDRIRRRDKRAEHPKCKEGGLQAAEQRKVVRLTPAERSIGSQGKGWSH